ncbi:hypothetical protein [Pseudomonas japonica]|uniref:hypothetical protein n=1 Tax=Pseudomonas japonica TaxID=256466 RepID=UPI003A83D653
MVAATKNRNTPQTPGHRRSYPVAANARCFAGTVAVIDATGLVQPAKAGPGLIAVGVFEHLADNYAGAVGDQVAEVLRGYFRLENSADADAITSAEIGQACYLVDDQTVAKTDGAGTRSIAGIVDGVDEVGVWVLVDPTSGVHLAAASAG